MKKRIISIMLVVVMVVAMIPVIALPSAANGEGTSNVITYTEGYAALDGNNLYGEYDGALEVPLTIYAEGTWYAKAPDANDVAYVKYTDDAIYVWINGDSAENGGIGSWDMTAIGFKIGTSYVGTNAGQSNNAAAYLYSSGTSTVDSTFFAINGELDLEVKFPVSGMNTEDQAAFADRTLTIELGFMNMDYYAYTSSFEIGEEKYSAFTDATLRDSHILANLVSFTLSTAADKVTTEGPVIPYSSTPAALDGQMGAGEYDNALVVSMVYSGAGWWAKTADENDVAYVKYTDDAIYIFIKGDNGATCETYDMTGIGFKVGTTFVGTKIIQNHYFGSTLVSTGSLAIADSNYDSYFATSYHANDSEYSQTHVDNHENEKSLDLEVRIPFNRLNTADKEALANGTLDIQFGFMNMENYKANASFPIGSYDAFTSQTNAETYVLPFLTSFKLGEKNLTEINFSGKAPTLDGVNEEGEYDDATIVPLAYAPNGWQNKAPDANDVAYVKYTTDALYVYVNGDPGELGAWDMTGIGFMIGESYIGTNVVQQNSKAPYLFNSPDAKSAATEDFFAVGENVQLEARFPLDGLTDADKAALANGTLEIKLGFMNMDEQKYTASIFLAPGNYDAFTIEAKALQNVLGNLIAFELGAKVSENDGTIDGANITISEDLTMNFLATVDTSYDVVLKVTTNNRTTVINGTPVEGEENKYAFAFTGISPQCMGDNIKAELVVQNVLVDTVAEYSVLENLNEVKDDTNEALINALLVYGAAAQKYADYNTDNLVTDLVAEVETIENTDKTLTEAIAGGQFVAAGVHFANANKLYFKFAVDTMEGVTVTVNDVDVTDKIEECDEGYIVYTDDIIASDFGTVYTVVLTIATDTVPLVQTLTYSVNAYAAAMYEGDTAMADLAKALYAYGAAVEAYLTPSNS